MSVTDKSNKILKNKAQAYLQLIEERKNGMLQQFENASTDSEKVEILKQGTLWLIEVIKSLVAKRI